MSHIYIAYANRDGRELAQRLTKDLEETGYKVWLDSREIRGGQLWAEEIKRAIQESWAMLLIMTPGSLQSPYVVGGDVEVSDIPTAIENKITILPLLYDDSIDVREFPFDIGKRQYIDFRHNYSSAFDQLQKALDNIRPPETVPTPPSSSGEKHPPEPTPPLPPALGSTHDPTPPIAPPNPDNPPFDPATFTRILTDSPTTLDLLAFRPYVVALTGFITYIHNSRKQHSSTEKSARNDMQKPLTICIDAPWGMGKTSLMHMIENTLTANPNFITCWFNAWKYDQEGSLWAALSLELLRQLGQRERGVRGRLFRWRMYYDFKKVVGNFVRLIVYAAIIFCLGLLGVIVTVSISSNHTEIQTFLKDTQALARDFGLWALVGVVIVAIIILGKAIFDRIFKSFSLNLQQYLRQPDYSKRLGLLNEFHADFLKLVRDVTQNGQHLLVIFIDDLDRCAPPKSTEIIEAINILVDSPYCIYIIGMDTKAVAASIEAKYKDLKENLVVGDDPGGLSLGQRFLEKIVQINFRIPKTSPKLIADFISTNLGLPMKAPAATPLSDKPSTPQPITPRIRGTETPPSATQREVQVSAEMQRKFEDRDEVQRVTAEQAAPCLDYNPRKIKRFMNDFRLRAGVADQRSLIKGGTIQLYTLGQWAIVDTRWPDFIEILLDEPNFAQRLLQADAKREELLKARQNASNQNDIQKLQTQFESYLDDARMKRFIQATDLIKLLHGIPQEVIHSDMRILEYLHLASLRTT